MALSTIKSINQLNDDLYHISLTLLGLCSIFRYYVISQLPRLEMLDDKKVEVNEKEEALRIYKRTVSL